jgi:hypothetical protein
LRPFCQSNPVAGWLSVLLALLLLLEALAGLLVPDLYRDAPAWAAQARGVNLVDLVVTLPTLIVVLLLAARGSRRARVVWLGVLGYVLYNAVIFGFTTAFNQLFLVYVGVLGVSVFASAALLKDGRIPLGHLTGAARTVVSVYLLALTALFLAAWLSEIVPALATQTTPSSIVAARLPTNPVYVLDLGVLLPLFIIAARRLLGQQPGAAGLCGSLLVLNVLLALSIVSSTVMQHAVDESVALAILPLFGMIGVSSLALAIWLLSASHP